MSGEQLAEAAQAACTDFVADGVDPRVALEGTLPSLPPTMLSLPPDPSRGPYPLPQSRPIRP